MELNISITKKTENNLFYSTLFIVLFLSILVRFLLFVNVKTLISSNDVVYHAMLTKMIIAQKTPLIYWKDGLTVNYPIGFHTLSAIVSVVFTLPNYRSVWAVAIALTGLQAVLAYFVGNEMGGRYIGLASAFFFGMGLFPWTPFLYGGMYANILGHVLLLILLYLILKYRLCSFKVSIICGLILGVLIMTHAIALSSFLLSFISIFLVNIYLKKNLNLKNSLLFLISGLIIALPWLLHIVKNIFLGYHSLGEPWEFSVSMPSDLLGIILYKFRFFLLFVPVGIYAIIKKYIRGTFVILWFIFLFGLSFTLWGNRFGMEMYLPLNFLASFGLVMIIETLIYRVKKVKIDSVFLMFIIAFFLVDTVDNLFFQMSAAGKGDVAEANLKALNWIQENTKEDDIFYSATNSAYIGYIIAYAGREVFNYTIISSADPSLIPTPERQEILKDIGKMELPEIFGGDEFHSLLLKYNVSYIYVFNKKGKTEWYDVKTEKHTIIYKTDLLDARKDLYEAIFENGYVKIYKIKKEKCLWHNDNEFVA